MAKNRLENTAGTILKGGILITTLGFQGCASYGPYHGGSFIQPEHLQHSQHSPVSQNSRGSHPQRPSYQAAPQPTQQPSHFNNYNNTAPHQPTSPQRQQHTHDNRGSFLGGAASALKDLGSVFKNTTSHVLGTDITSTRPSLTITDASSYNNVRNAFMNDCVDNGRSCYGSNGVTLNPIEENRHIVDPETSRTMVCSQKGFHASFRERQETNRDVYIGFSGDRVNAPVAETRAQIRKISSDATVFEPSCTTPNGRSYQIKPTKETNSAAYNRAAQGINARLNGAVKTSGYTPPTRYGPAYPDATYKRATALGLSTEAYKLRQAELDLEYAQRAAKQDRENAERIDKFKQNQLEQDLKTQKIISRQETKFAREGYVPVRLDNGETIWARPR